jgi:hypothetical protein
LAIFEYDYSLNYTHLGLLNCLVNTFFLWDFSIIYFFNPFKCTAFSVIKNLFWVSVLMTIVLRWSKATYPVFLFFFFLELKANFKLNSFHGDCIQRMNFLHFNNNWWKNTPFSYWMNTQYLWLFFEFKYHCKWDLVEKNFSFFSITHIPWNFFMFFLTYLVYFTYILFSKIYSYCKYT